MHKAEIREGTFSWLASRLAVALVSGVAAALTLFAWSTILFLLTRARPPFGPGIVEFIASGVYSETGVAVVGGAAFVGFCLGGDRMAEIFSVFWGTHPLWSKARAYLGKKTEPLNVEYHPPAWLLIGIAVALVLLLGVTVAAAEEPQLEVVSAEFGLFNALETGRPPFIATPLVPLVANQAYGWVIVLKTSEKTVRWREEFTLPAAPATWGGPESIGTRSMSDDGRTTITEREVTLYNGVIFNSWSVARGDPPGTYRMRVSVEGKLVRTFEFRVE